MTRLVVEFAIGSGGGVEVHIVPSRLQAQVHIEIGGGRCAMDLVLQERLLEAPRGVLEGREGLVVLADGTLLSNRLHSGNLETHRRSKVNHVNGGA